MYQVAGIAKKVEQKGNCQGKACRPPLIKPNMNMNMDMHMSMNVKVQRYDVVSLAPSLPFQCHLPSIFVRTGQSCLTPEGKQRARYIQSTEGQIEN